MQELERLEGHVLERRSGERPWLPISFEGQMGLTEEAWGGEVKGVVRVGSDGDADRGSRDKIKEEGGWGKREGGRRENGGDNFSFSFLSLNVLCLVE